MSDEKMEHSPLPCELKYRARKLNTGGEMHIIATTDEFPFAFIPAWTANEETAAEALANAEFIVTACNSYYTNKTTVAKLVEALEWISSLQYKDSNTVTPDNAFEAFGQQNKMVVDIFKKADTLIAKHKAGE